VLGWGSLIWQPANCHGELKVEAPWHEDGPDLPVEFARISSDGRLTLVLLPGHPHALPVLWARSCFGDALEAAANLAERETGAPLRTIHGVCANGRTLGAPEAGIVTTVRAWMAQRPLDAVIWTGLTPGSRWTELGWAGFTPDAAVAYVSGLRGGTRRRAEDYLRRAPAQIDTPLRGRLLAALEDDPREGSRGPRADRPSNGPH